MPPAAAIAIRATAREIAKILTQFTETLRPFIDSLIHSYKFLIRIDFIQAKYGFGEDLGTEHSIDDISELPELLENLEYSRVFFPSPPCFPTPGEIINAS